MQGVTAAIVAFILVSLAFPTLIKNKTYFYAALTAIVAVILLDACGHVAPSGAFGALLYFVCACLQVTALLLLVAASGGMAMRDLRDEFGGMYEVIRRGGEGKEVVIPLPESMQRMKDKAQAQAQAARSNQPQDPQVFHLDPAAAGAAPNPPSQPKKSEDHGPLPLV